MAKDLWIDFSPGSYQEHVTISTIDSEDADDTIVYKEDLEKRKQVYGICGECKEPGGFGKIYSAEWPEGNIKYWDIENQEWHRYKDYDKYALKSLNNSSDISSDFLDEVKSYLQIHLFNIVRCFGITQNPNTKEFMMVLMYCENVNSSDLSSFQFNSDTNTQSESANPISECLDVQLSELELNEIYQDNKNDIE
ncbi:unnamed protein product [Rhizophagus irregularis]|nr:unnamed protein product [Rhizophagus irregularis]CAB5365835.1 unnamed protein product [Rhizophagus irregularis]